MRRIALDSVIPGQKLAKTIFSSDGMVLLETGIELTIQHISRLQLFGVKELYIEDAFSEGIICTETISEETRMEAKNLVRKIMSTSANSLDSQYIFVEKYVNLIIDQLLLKDDIIINLNEIRIVDDYTFEHSVNVCVLSLTMGVSLGYTKDDLIELGIGAILHDIGKLKIPDNILKKPSQLSRDEFTIIQNHALYGYEILSRCKNITQRSAEVALYHHERADGSGYPNRLLLKEIPEFARITAVADVFDALSSDRVYRNKLSTRAVVDYMLSIAGKNFDEKVISNFIKLIEIFPVGSIVLLCNGEKAIVLSANKNNPVKPKVRIVKDKNGLLLINYFERDLALDSNLYILQTCEL